MGAEEEAEEGEEVVVEGVIQVLCSCNMSITLAHRCDCCTSAHPYLPWAPNYSASGAFYDMRCDTDSIVNLRLML